MTNRNNWKPSISVGFGAFNNERMSELRDNGICCVEMSEGNAVIYEDFAEHSKQMFRTASDNGVCVHSVHLPFYPKTVFDPAGASKDFRDYFLNLETEMVKIIADRGAKIVVVHPSQEPYEDSDRDMHLAYAAESLSALNEVAKQAGIILAVENLPRTCMCRDCSEIKKLIEYIPSVSFCFDSNHSLIDSNIDIIKAMGNRIVATHFSDYDFIDERHLMPGMGKNDWQRIIKCLEEVDYNGTWNYEVGNADRITGAEFKANYEGLMSGKI